MFGSWLFVMQIVFDCEDWSLIYWEQGFETTNYMKMEFTLDLTVFSSLELTKMPKYNTL